MQDPQRADRQKIRTWVRSGRTQVAPEHAGVRLDRFLAGRFTYRSRTQWGRLIREGRVTVNRRPARPSRPLRPGDSIDYVPLRATEPPIDPTYALLFEDDWLIAVAKSGNLPVHPSGRYFRNTLLHLLQVQHPQWQPLHVIHRLDRETSGVVLFGRSRAAAGKIAVQFRARSVGKRYLALVEGSPREDRFVIDLPLGPAIGSAIRKAVGVRSGGIAARTEVCVLHRGHGWAWLEVRAHTGRLHQIRVHLKAVGLPILGDKVYGRDERLFLKFIAGQALSETEQKLLALPRQALHAYQVTIHHPASGELLTVTAPLPADLAAALSERGLDPSQALPPALPEDTPGLH